MKNTETGEPELVLGNKQLLSGFFIVIILFGVFFIMGYILGRNSAPAGTRTASAETTPPSRSEPRPPAGAGNSSPAAAQTAAEAPPPAPAESAPPQPTTQPAREPDAPAATPAATSGPIPVTEPEPGQTYLQVMAVKKPEAEVVARTLKDKGFPASLAPGPTDYVRVLVGPYKDTASLGAAKAELENAGFRPIVRK